MTKFIMHGCNGKMGKVISSLATQKDNFKVVAGIDMDPTINFDYPVFTNFDDCNVDADVIIDFSTASVVETLIDFAVKKKIPLLVCTTGLSTDIKNKLEDASRQIPVLNPSNTSVGVNLMLKLVKDATKALQNSFDIEVVEKHHNQKIDSPSGTALSIVESIVEACNEPQEYVYDRHSTRKKRSKHEIGIHAIRGGTIVGEHTVIYAGDDEIIEIKHTAMSKNIFANGAMRAAEFLKDKKPGFYLMGDIL